MIQDFQQTTMASIGLVAEANTVCCGDRLPRYLELRLRFCSHNYLSSPVQPTVSPCLPTVTMQSKNTASVAVAVDSYTTASRVYTRSSAIAEGPRDASCQLKSCQLPRNSAETTGTTSPDQIDGMKLEV